MQSMCERRRRHPVSDMLAFGVIEHFNVVEDVLSGLLAGFVHAFTFEQVEETFSDSVLQSRSSLNS